MIEPIGIGQGIYMRFWADSALNWPLLKDCFRFWKSVMVGYPQGSWKSFLDCLLRSMVFLLVLFFPPLPTIVPGHPPSIIKHKTREANDPEEWLAVAINIVWAIQKKIYCIADERQPIENSSNDHPRQCFGVFQAFLKLRYGKVFNIGGSRTTSPQTIFFLVISRAVPHAIFFCFGTVAWVIVVSASFCLLAHLIRTFLQDPASSCWLILPIANFATQNILTGALRWQSNQKQNSDQDEGFSHILHALTYVYFILTI